MTKIDILYRAIIAGAIYYCVLDKLATYVVYQQFYRGDNFYSSPKLCNK